MDVRVCVMCACACVHACCPAIGWMTPIVQPTTVQSSSPPHNSNPTLRCWVSAQRSAYRAECQRIAGMRPTYDGRISPERIERLNSIDFVWVPDKSRAAEYE